ncbi:MAG TPA: hypothetical protein VJ251_10390, partial [Stellaceae bacterium]|nr:hypothetical protein [Stellaceae bacterium]
DWLMHGSSFARGSIGTASDAFKLHAWKRRIYLGRVRGERQPHLRSMRIAAVGEGEDVAREAETAVPQMRTREFGKGMGSAH